MAVLGRILIHVRPLEKPIIVILRATPTRHLHQQDGQRNANTTLPLQQFQGVYEADTSCTATVQTGTRGRDCRSFHPRPLKHSKANARTDTCFGYSKYFGVCKHFYKF